MNIFTKFTEYIHYVPYCTCSPSPLSPSRSMHYYDNVPHHPCAHWPCALSPMCSIILPLMLMCPIAHVSHCSCAHYPAPCRSRRVICHIAHMPHILLPWEMGYIGDGAAICQSVKWWKVVKKMSNCQTHGLWKKFTNKKWIHIMRFTNIDVNFDIGHIWW